MNFWTNELKKLLMSNDHYLEAKGTGIYLYTGQDVLSSYAGAPQIWHEETLLFAVGKLGVFLKLT